MDIRVKALADGEWRVTLCASGVPLALMATLHLVVARIDGTLRLLVSLNSFAPLDFLWWLTSI